MHKGGRKHKRQATRRRKRQDNPYCEYTLKKSGFSTEKWFRDRFVWDDCCRKWHRNYTTQRSWKNFRKTQYKPKDFTK